MTRFEKLIIGVTVVVLGIGSMALMWTSRQVGKPPVVVEEKVVSVTTTPREPVRAPQPANVAPPPPAPIPVAQAAVQQDTSGGVAPQPAVAPSAQAAPPPATDGVQPTADEREQRNAAVRSLQAVEAQLATGNTDGVDEVLSKTGEQLDEPARSAVGAARTALENRDLTMARAAVIRAISATPTR
ncbi:MAG: hypothetical protein ACO1OB_21885 [Archangium sp.]